MKSIFSLLVCLLFFMSLNSQNPFPNPGEVFQDHIIPKVYIDISQNDLNTILDPVNIGSTVHYPATFIYDTGSDSDLFESIGFRLRGNTSQGANKKSYKVSFNTFVPGRKYNGLEKLNINGEHNDPSVIRSKVCWDLCRKMGIPAPRANHVELYINDEYWGLYINVEHIDEEFVQLRFGEELGNLYKCLWPADLEYLGSNPNLYKMEFDGRRAYDLKTNTAEDDYSDLAHFIDVLNNTPAEDLPCELESIFDVQNFLKVIALDVLIGNWDGHIFNQNNFYLYSNPQTGKIHYIPYDLDNTLGVQWFGDWANRNVYNWAPGNEPRPIYKRLMQNEVYRAQYSYYLSEFLDLYFNETSLFEELDNRKSLIEGSIPDDPLYPLDYGFTFDDFSNSYTDGVAVSHIPYGLKEYITLRRNSALNQLESSNAAPIITNIQHQISNSNQDIAIRATIEDATTVEAKVEYEFNGMNEEIIMYDDGQHQDGAAGDQIFGAVIPAPGEAGTFSYYVSAIDSEQATNRFPLCESFSAEVLNTSVALYINEFQADNESTITDEFGEYEDWIELYNDGTTPIDLSDYFLSDNADNIAKWQLPDATIAPGEFLIIWADKDEDQGIFHANFKLNNDGESIFLSNSFGSIIDQVIYTAVGNNQAIGRLPNGTGAMQAVFQTPGASNEPPVSVSLIGIPEFAIHPNPFISEINIQAGIKIKEIELYDSSGRLLLNKSISDHSVELQMPPFSAGLYLIKIHFENGTQAVEKLVKCF